MKWAHFLKITNGLRYSHPTLLIYHFCLPRKFFQARRFQKIIGELTKPIFENLRLLFKIIESRYLVKQCVINKYGYAEKLLVFTPGWRGIVVTVQAGGQEDGCQPCGTHISVIAWRIFSIRSSMKSSRPVVVHCHDHVPICPIWACPWTKSLSHLPQIVERISLKSLDGFTTFKVSWTCQVVQRHSYLPICPVWACPWAKTCQIRQHLGQTLRNPYLWTRWIDLYHSKFYGIF